MPAIKKKYTKDIEVEETSDGVILHLFTDPDLGFAIGFILLFIGIMAFIPYLNDVSAHMPWICIAGVALVSSILLLRGLVSRSRRIVLDSHELRYEIKNSFGIRSPLRIPRVGLSHIMLHYLHGNYIAIVRIVQKDGNDMYLIEDSAKNAQKIADVLNHNLQWLKVPNIEQSGTS